MKHVDVLPTIEYANRKFPTACWSLVTGLCMLISVLSGSCSAENETDKANNNNVDKSNERLQLVFITTCVNEDFFKPVQKGIHDAAELMNVEYTFVGTEGVDAQGQVKLMEEAIQNGAHGIALNIIDSVVFDDVVRDAVDSGIPVVAFNSDDNYTDNARLSSVCQNLYKAGQELGKKMAGELAVNSTVLLTVHSEGISALEERVRGIKDALKEKKLTFIEVVTGNKIDSATEVMNAALKKNPDVKRVLCTGLADTEATGNVIAAGLRKEGVQAAGFDLSPGIITHIKNGHLLFTIDQQPYMQGFLPVIQLAQYLRYGIVPSDNEIGAAFVTRENAGQVEQLTESGYR